MTLEDSLRNKVVRLLLALIGKRSRLTAAITRLYSFAPRKAKERRPVDNMLLGRFNCDLFLVLRPDTLNLSWNKLQR